MEELVNCLCKQGRLIVTERNIILEPAVAMGGYGQRKSIARAMIAGVDSKRTVPTIFGKGGAYSLVLHTIDGRHLSLDMVPPDAAKRIVELLS